MRALRLLPVLALLTFTSPVLAWNNQGHMMVAAIAYARLDDVVKAKVAALLKLNPFYPRWVAGVPAHGHDEVAFIKAALWPDAIKSSSAGYTNDGENPTGKLTETQNIGYDDQFQHRYWHFVDTPFSPDGSKVFDPPSPNARTQIAAFRTALASAHIGAEVKSYDLVWLIHLVGDVHQPLHAASRFTAASAKSAQPEEGDRRGNVVRIACSPSCPLRNLHALWDDALGTEETVAAAKEAADALAPADSQMAGISDENVWIREGFNAAKSDVYYGPIKVGHGPFTVDGNYREHARHVSANRVALAGARLANLINAALR